MDKTIGQIYRGVVENSQYTKEIDKKLEDYLEKIVSLCPNVNTRKEEDIMLGVAIEMLQCAKESMFILGFRYAAQLGIEAIIDYNGENVWKRLQNMKEC